MQPLFRKRTTGTAAEFYLRRPENLLLVKRERDGGVLICATADNLSEVQRAAFVRYLNEEGFVLAALELSVRWIVDSTWPQVDPVYLRHLQRLCWCLAGTMVVCLALVAALVCF